MKHIQIEEKAFCTGCGACTNTCPKHCISFEEDAEGFSYPKVDESLCVECGKCIAVCPVQKEKPADLPLDNIKVFACVNKDKKVLKESSSGGIFTLLAEKIIKKGGVVYGSAFDNQWNVCHVGVDTLEGLEKFRGSKYVQSQMGDSYSQAKAFLEQGRPVLFSGTPCQIAGFNRFLGKEYPHLVTCDFICTGVPNPKAFRAYREHYAKRWKEPITGIAFRDKQYGWDSFSMVIRGKTKQYRKVRFFDPFIQAFYSHLLLRPACYHCQFKKYNSGSDIKLADYWYVKRVHPEIYHRDGVSLVMMGTAKGQALFDSVAPEMEKVESSMKNVFQTNASFETIVKEPPSRKEYLHTICHTDSTEDIVHCIKKLAKQPLKNQLVAKLRFYKQQLFARK